MLIDKFAAYWRSLGYKKYREYRDAPNQLELFKENVYKEKESVYAFCFARESKSEAGKDELAIVNALRYTLRGPGKRELAEQMVKELAKARKEIAQGNSMWCDAEKELLVRT